ncbi:MAG: AraC family transcriptional regulator [Clostridiales bacterium]|nr:AraC family transcriptional regulator [Clostridiales bacterium]
MLESHSSGNANSSTFENFSLYHESGVDLTLVECGYEKCDPEHYFSGTKGYHTLHVVISGKGTVEYQGRIIHVTAGQGFYLPKDEISTYTADAEEPWEYRWVGFIGTQATIAMTMTDLAKEICFDVPDVARVSKRLADMYEAAIRETEAGRMLALGNLYIMLSEMVENHSNSTRGASAAAKYVNSAIAMIRENYQGKFSVSDICSQLNLTRSYIYKLFIQYCHMSPLEYLLRFRLEKARELLASGTCPINEVAERSGFSSHAYFGKRFREVYNMSPREYVQHVRKEK